MNEGIQKAIVSIIGGVVIVFNSAFGSDLNLDPFVINSLAAIITSILVYAIPNRKKSDGQ